VIGSRHFPAAILVAALALLAGCGGASVHPGDAAVAEAGWCGTHDDPGILMLADLMPPLGATVDNHDIVHGFTVLDAPAEFRNFELKFGPNHTAGLPNPEQPKFTLVTVESDVTYQLTIVSWARSPAHVELMASAGFDTSTGCSWKFPAPLFSYDVVGGPDGGGTTVDAPAKPDAALPADTPADRALPPVDAPLDGSTLPTVDASLDIGVSLPVDTTVDGGVPDAPEGLDTAGGEVQPPSTDVPLPADSGVG
jgi:hypothetical protein